MAREIFFPKGDVEADLRALEEDGMIFNNGALPIECLKLGLFSAVMKENPNSTVAIRLATTITNTLLRNLQGQHLWELNGKGKQIIMLSPAFTKLVLAAEDNEQFFNNLCLESGEYIGGIKNFGDGHFLALKQVLGEYEANDFDVAKTVDQWLGEII